MKLDIKLGVIVDNATDFRDAEKLLMRFKEAFPELTNHVRVSSVEVVGSPHVCTSACPERGWYDHFYHSSYDPKDDSGN